MQSCSEEHYWDPLLMTCVSCKPICSRRNQRICATFCKSLSCRKEPDKYYDLLLSDCVSCTSICGQHPRQCADFCEAKAKGQSYANPPPELWRQRTEETGAKPNSSGRDQGSDPRVLEAAPLVPGLALSGDQLALVYITMGLCLCAIVGCFLMAVACFLRRRSGQCSYQLPPESCQTTSSQDHLMETGSVGGGMPKPVETCSFCFNEQRMSTEKNTGGHRGQGLGPEERWWPLPRTTYIQPSSNIDHSGLKIICAPSQERGSTT
ncbi:PREDICTED: tumor necrosis factor receptor superfamily member 13B-like [Elephantulus edwardii]|uniref:tumor necrosis factor receptor superfamily member 13B-like n=1 Tax=Elephantulus edwardii TaxID=28737 RepID=UPI0003F0BA69|nr:PREDICTED: tumor necrosis factor receptor superfamily member 13B-like [Elephantulus edwardii]